ncbi:MAG: hypothetical protein P4L33_13620 [Capsulimonadaceae bacterium]|nr:hypothetical protein [Capsulimonadaceae bacterium]
MTNELARRLEQAEAAAAFSWCTAIETPPRTTFQVKASRHGKATVLISRDLLLGSSFSRVLGFGEENVAELPVLIDLFAKERSPLRIDLNPYCATPGILKELSAFKMRPIRHQSILYGPCGAPDISELPTKQRSKVRLIGAADAQAWARVWRESYAQMLGVSPAALVDLSLATAALHKTPNWNLYLATIDSEPAAVSTLYIHDGIGFLGQSGTLPQFRGQGCHASMLRQRLSDAFQNNCLLMSSVADLGSIAQHNLERAELRIGYTRAYWVRFP